MTSIQSGENYSVSASINDSPTTDRIDSWVTEYIFDYAASLKEREKKRPPFRKWSPQLHIRGEIVDFIKAISERLHFSQSTHHLAVYIIDRFLDDYNIIREPYVKFFGLVCLIVAAKHEENESMIPKLSVLRQFVDVDFSRQDFITLEFDIMQHFNWRLSVPTAVNFCDHHCLFAVFQSDSEAFGFSIKNLRSILRALTYDYLDITLSETDFLYFSPSKVAAVCLRAARVALKLTPPWPKILEMSIGYKEEDLIPCYKLLLRSIVFPDGKRKKEFGSPESGYWTDSDSTVSPDANKRQRKSHSDLTVSPDTNKRQRKS